MDASDLIAGYEVYTNADELNVAATVDAPATTLPCSICSPLCPPIHSICC
ncbi:MAG: LxmA leader domain family RiPP [Egibacteraceae bacterium]